VVEDLIGALPLILEINGSLVKVVHLLLLLAVQAPFVTSQDARLEINRKPKCALHSCIENLGNFRAFNKTYQSDQGFACVNGN
jgi:hypothetical protein